MTLNSEIEWPNGEIRHAGVSILSEFQDFLFINLERVLKPIFGPEWFEKCVTSDKWKSKSQSKDLYSVLKETVEYANQNFRMAISKSIFDRTYLTKSEIEKLGAILNYRNKWAHEPSQSQEKITRTDLMNLAQCILDFSKSESLSLSCKNILQSSNLADLVFSIPVVARHLPENIKNFEQLQAIAIKLTRNSSQGSSNSASEAELFEALQTAMHGWKSSNRQWELLLVKYRILQAQILNKIHVDSSNIVGESKSGVFDSLSFGDAYDESCLMESVHDYIDSIFPVEDKMIQQVQEDVKNLTTDNQVEDDCNCEFCKIAPNGLGPLFETDAINESFLQDKVFNRKSGVRFIKLSPTEGI
jgi:hypothetical protein